jgi:hypothetical protein
MQQIAMIDTETGELTERKLEHDNGQARSFYVGLTEPALVRIESTGYTRWFAPARVSTWFPVDKSDLSR